MLIVPSNGQLISILVIALIQAASIKGAISLGLENGTAIACSDPMPIKVLADDGTEPLF